MTPISRTHPDLNAIDSPALTGLIHDRLRAMEDAGGELYLLDPLDTHQSIQEAVDYYRDPQYPLGPYEDLQWHAIAKVYELTYITSDDGYALVFLIPRGSLLEPLLKETL